MEACIICTEEKLNSLEHAKSIFRQTLCTQKKLKNEKEKQKDIAKSTSVCVYNRILLSVWIKL